MFKPENRRELIPLLTGFVLLGVGVSLLLVGFGIAFGIVGNPVGYLESQIPPSAQNATQGPRASFMFTVTDFAADFTDNSQSRDAPIVGYDWDFGDGVRSNQRNPSHTYSGNFSGFVRLTVRDDRGRENSAIGSVQAGPGASLQGNSMADPGDIAGSLDLGSVFAPILNVAIGTAAVVATFFMLLIMWLVGASLTKAGWNLIRPRPETIRIRVKPKHLEAEPVYSAQAMPAQPMPADPYAAPIGPAAPAPPPPPP
ncbi:MAG TPA: PKD domain-containing protein [Thermoplasmata archaeon]|nr:PKD domain-containing protein [Thermoplasmata archaeon]